MRWIGTGLVLLALSCRVFPAFGFDPPAWWGGKWRFAAGEIIYWLTQDKGTLPAMFGCYTVISTSGTSPSQLTTQDALL